MSDELSPGSDDDTAVARKTKATVRGDETVNQDNITLDKPGSMTIIIKLIWRVLAFSIIAPYNSI